MDAVPLNQTPAMEANLSNTDKDFIRNQEAFRMVVQREQAEKKHASRASAVWGVLNNSFTIFLFTSILVPLTAYFYASRVATAQASAKVLEINLARTDRIEKLDTEVAFRLSRALAQLEAATAAPETSQAGLINQVLSSISTRTIGGDRQTLYPAFADHSLLSLMSELRSELIASGDLGEQAIPTAPGSVSHAIKSLSVLAVLGDAKQSPKEVATALLKIASYVHIRTEARRWDREFAYTGCKLEKPFC